MGRRSQHETVATVLVTLLRKRTCNQAELARAAGVQPRTIRKRMFELLAAGVPLERDEEPPHVYWSVPKTWFPDGGVLTASQLSQVVRMLARQRKTKDREKLLTELLDALPSTVNDTPNQVELDLPNDILSVIEDAASKKVPLRMTYFSASRGDASLRHASVHRIEYAAATRFVATCHRDERMKWFRADRVERPALDQQASFRSVDARSVDQFVDSTFKGFRGAGDVKPYTFTVRWPEGRWVLRNLPHHVADPKPEHVRVVIETAGLDALARHLVGLGELVRAETPELRACIVDLARGALRTNGDVRKVNEGSATAKRSAG